MPAGLPVAAAILGGAVAAGSHFTKAGARSRHQRVARTFQQLDGLDLRGRVGADGALDGGRAPGGVSRAAGRGLRRGDPHAALDLGAG
jgi:hypothetical protein